MVNGRSQRKMHPDLEESSEEETEFGNDDDKSGLPGTRPRKQRQENEFLSC
jgi:hypothetical protein